MFNLPIKILQTKKIETDQASVTFSDIDDLVALWDALKDITSRHLVLMVNLRSTVAVTSRYAEMRFNGDTGNNYHYEFIEGENAVASAAKRDNYSYINPFRFPGTSTYPNAFGGGLVVIPHAFNTTNHKTILSMSGCVEDSVMNVAGRWASIAAITSISFSPNSGNFTSGSTFSIGVIDEQYLEEEIEIAGSDSNPTFNNIPQVEGDLLLIAYAQSDFGGVNGDAVKSIINKDNVNANYTVQDLTGLDAATSAASLNNNLIGVVGSSGSANVFGGMALSYCHNLNQPHILGFSGFHSSDTPRGHVTVRSMRRNNTEPINDIQLTPNTGNYFKVGSLFSLYRVPKRVIERVELTEDTADVTFANIPQNFETLQLTMYARTDRAAVEDYVMVHLNNDGVAGNYNTQYLSGAAAVVTAARGVGSRIFMTLPAATEGEGEYGGGYLLIPSYSETDRHKHVLEVFGREENNIYCLSGRRLNTEAISSIVLVPNVGPNFLAGSVFELEGILKKEGLPPSEGTKI